MADGFERCYNKAFAPRRDLEAKLRAQKKSDEDIQKAVAAAVKDGTLPQPPKAMMSYRGFDKTRSDPEPVGDVAAQRHARSRRRVDGEPARRRRSPDTACRG